MENFVRNSKLNIEKEIKRIEQQPIAPLERIKQIIDVIQTSLTLLKRAVAEYQFQNPEEEIQFFKVWKPQISGLLMFYIRLDDATIFPFLVPSNFFAVASLRQASEMVQKITKDNVLADELLALSKEVYNALQTYAVVNHPKFGKIYAFEIDGFGSAYLSDDANVPNLLALPYLGGVDSDDAIYANTRRFVWSEYNPYFFKGSYFEGIGGHHIGTDMIWPMSLIMKALTAQDDEELQQCIQMLQKTHAGTGFMHESFHKDDPKKFTRSWFAWANTLFGELLWKTFNEKPYLLEY